MSHDLEQGILVAIQHYTNLATQSTKSMPIFLNFGKAFIAFVVSFIHIF